MLWLLRLFFQLNRKRKEDNVHTTRFDWFRFSYLSLKNILSIWCTFTLGVSNKKITMTHLFELFTYNYFFVIVSSLSAHASESHLDKRRETAEVFFLFVCPFWSIVHQNCIRGRRLLLTKNSAIIYIEIRPESA